MQRKGIYIYIVFYAATLIPVWKLDYFHTGDGPSHLYVATVLADLIANESSVFSDYFFVRPRPVPNVIVTLVYSCLLQLFSPSIATKILLSLVILLLTGGYFAFASALTKRKAIPVSIFLLVYAFPLKMGLFGFLAGTGVMLFAMAFYIATYHAGGKIRQMQMAALLLACWLFHLFPFLLLMLMLVTYEIVKQVLEKREYWRKNLQKRVRSLLLLSSPSLVLTLLFSQQAVNDTVIRYADFESLKSWMTGITAMEFFGSDSEFVVRKIFYVLLLLAFVVAVIERKRMEKVAVTFLVNLFSILLLLYFILPDDLFSGGMINLRVQYIVLVLLCMFADIALAGLMQWIKTALLCIAVYIAASGVYSIQKEYSQSAGEVVQAGFTVNAGSSLLPLNYSVDPFEYNMLLYLSAGRKAVVLDNAQAATPNSIVQWRRDRWRQRDAYFLKTPAGGMTLQHLDNYSFDYVACYKPDNGIGQLKVFYRSPAGIVELRSR